MNCIMVQASILCIYKALNVLNHILLGQYHKQTNKVGFDRSSYKNCKDIEVTLFQFNHICMHIIKNFICRINNTGLGAPSTIFERLKKIGGNGGRESSAS